MINNQSSGMPEQYRPPIDGLPRDMQLIATGMEERFPGLGVLIALALAEIINGQCVYIGQMRGPLRAWRDDLIRAQYDQGGVTIRELASNWRLSQSSIEKILAKPASQGELEQKQMKLF